MGNRLMSLVLVFGVQAKNWMLIALANILVGIVFASWSNRQTFFDLVRPFFEPWPRPCLHNPNQGDFRGLGD
jgi:hypothetical protein